MLWNNCKFDTFYYDREASCDNPCSVEIADGHILVWYDDADESGRHIVTTYEGEEISLGHFELSALAKDGRSSLHTFNGGRFLDGFWVEGGQRGMWRITLA